MNLLFDTLNVDFDVLLIMYVMNQSIKGFVVLAKIEVYSVSKHV